MYVAYYCNPSTKSCIKERFDICFNYKKNPKDFLRNMDHIAKSFQHYHVSIINSKIHLSTWRKISVIKKFIKINNFKPYIKFLHNTLVTHK